ncbi:MAG: histidinol-phosphate aminotransferase family protein [Candidatus Cloacimonetes bacterium]|nr:histidinol-phosphate aminotransferase family protein [Candidatus Cloacimonadota bacterium]
MVKLFRKDLIDKKPSVVDVPQRKRMMCLNESCMNPFEVVQDDFLKRMQNIQLNRYISPVADELRQKLADYVGHKMQPENLVWGNGADDMIFHTILSVREDERSFAVSPAPSYFDYKTYTDMVGMGMHFVELDEDFRLDPAQYIAAASHPDCKLAILCNPNNPTGNLFPKDDLRTIVEALPDKLVLLDETYYEFSGESLIDELERHPNLILVRSFSKAFSGAGLRFGYAISSASNIYNLRKVFITFHSSVLAQAFALSILDNIPAFRQQVAQISALRQDAYHQIKIMPQMTVQPSHTNFLAFTVGEQTPQLFQYLKTRDIALRDIGGQPRLKNYLRATLSCEDDTKELIKEMWNWLDMNEIRRHSADMEEPLREGIAGM